MGTDAMARDAAGGVGGATETIVSLVWCSRSIGMTEILKGKVALVTGAGAEIGLATAWAFAEAGASGGSC